MRGNLGDDPAVIAIATALRINADEVVGKLHRLWWWADQNTASGEIAWVSGAWIDEHVRKRGFSAAMQKVGWLVIGADSITFPEFDRHNGASAKARALDTNRKKQERETGQRVSVPSAERHAANRTNVRTVSGSEPDETRTREEKKDLNLNQGQKQEQSRARATPPAQKSPRGTRLPENWSLPDDWKAWALTERHEWNEAAVIGVSLLFRDHWLGKGEARADWLATWRNWVRREQARGPPAKSNRQPTLAERKVATVDAVIAAGRKPDGRDIEGTASTVDQPPIPALAEPVREPDGDDVGSGGPK